MLKGLTIAIALPLKVFFNTLHRTLVEPDDWVDRLSESDSEHESLLLWSMAKAEIGLEEVGLELLLGGGDGGDEEVVEQGLVELGDDRDDLEELGGLEGGTDEGLGDGEGFEVVLVEEDFRDEGLAELGSDKEGFRELVFIGRGFDEEGLVEDGLVEDGFEEDGFVEEGFGEDGLGEDTFGEEGFVASSLVEDNLVGEDSFIEDEFLDEDNF